MRILIVNAFSQVKEGFKKFSEFQYYIMKTLAEQKELIDTETEFFIRAKDNLDDFLYDIENSYLRRDAANNFDQLDLVCITGDSNVRPWSESMRKVMILIRMCLKVKKYLFACSFGMQALVFLCASNMEKDINIINGQGSGGKLSEIHEFYSQAQSIKHNDYFLDNTTGDMYGFNYEIGEWVPKGNCGLHYRRSAQEYQSIGKYILKAPQYKPKQEHSQKYQLFKSRKYEELCVIKKMYLQHWAFTGMDTEFIVPLKNSWDIHTFTFTNSEKTFTVLAESTRGGIIIELKNMLATLFATTQKYPQTLLPLKNFIHQTLRQIKEQNNQLRVSIAQFQFNQKNSSIEEVLKTQKKKFTRNALLLMNERAKKMGFMMDMATQKEETLNSPRNVGEDEFRHVGFSAKKSHVPQIVHANAIGSKHLKMIDQSKINKPNQNSYNNIFNELNESNNSLNNSRQGIGDSNNIQKNNDLNKRGSTALLGKLIGNETNQNRHSRYLSQHNFTPQNVELNFSNKSTDRNVIQQEREQMFSQGGVRKMLHPTIPNEYLNFQKLWVPGLLSPKSVRESTANSIKLRSSSNFISQNNFFKSQQGLKASIIQPGKLFGDANSIFNGTPYESKEEIYLKDQKERDKKILGKRVLSTKITSYDLQDKITYINPETPKTSFFCHTFRDQNKSKWLGSQFTFH